MVPLRVIALASNILFAAFGALAHIYPVLILHIILLPVNAVRLIQIRNLIKCTSAIQLSDISINSLRPFMSRRLAKAGHVLIKRGELADRMYYLVRGKMKISETEKIIEPGTILGEIGIFSRDQKRTATVACVEDCEIYELSGSKVKEIYSRDGTFGLAMLQLIIARLLEDPASLNKQEV